LWGIETRNCHYKMKSATVEELAFFLNKDFDAKRPAPIFFLGAGASYTGGIPLASEIIQEIINGYSDYPSVQNLEPARRSYPNLMDAIGTDARNELLRGYIDKAKINVTHVYLAQMMIKGYADHVLTVNFDNLMLRALALFNEFPATYDLAILKDLTTTTPKKGSVVYLHGQHHGLWLLNTDAEMRRPGVHESITAFFHSIKDRPWIFIGYSGEDPIFNLILSLGNFDKGLYWVSYLQNPPCGDVCTKLLSAPDKNAKIIAGYDADAFVLKLSIALGLKQPDIFDKPFSALKTVLNNVVDIKDEEHLIPVKIRFDIAMKQVQTAINFFELGDVLEIENQKEQIIDILKKDVINLGLTRDFNESQILPLETRSKSLNNEAINLLVAWLYVDLGDRSVGLAFNPNETDKDQRFNEAYAQYQHALEVYHKMHEALNHWGNALTDQADTKAGLDAEALYLEAADKYKRALIIKPKFADAYYNWGIALGKMAKSGPAEKAEQIVDESIDKYRKATEINPNHHEAFHNWGNALGDIAIKATDNRSDKLFHEVVSKYQKAIEIKPDKSESYYNWGTFLGQMAKKKTGNEADILFASAYEKFELAIKFQPNMHLAYGNWSTFLIFQSHLKKTDEAHSILLEALAKARKSYEFGGKCYNIGCVHALFGEKDEALEWLNNSLENKDVTAQFVNHNDPDWNSLKDDSDFISLIASYSSNV